MRLASGPHASDDREEGDDHDITTRLEMNGGDGTCCRHIRVETSDLAFNRGPEEEISQGGFNILALKSTRRSDGRLQLMSGYRMYLHRLYIIEIRAKKMASQQWARKRNMTWMVTFECQSQPGT